MRKLTAYQARACEEARGTRCECRCMGTLHGQSHAALHDYERRTGRAFDPEALQLALPEQDEQD